MTEKEFILEFVKRYKDYQEKAAAIIIFDNAGRMEHAKLKIDLLLFCIEHEEALITINGRTAVIGLEIAKYLANLFRKESNGIVEMIVQSWQLLIDG